MLLDRVVDALVNGYFPVLASLDDEIDEIEDEILGRSTGQQLGRLFDMKRSLVAMPRWSRLSATCSPHCSVTTPCRA